MHIPEFKGEIDFSEEARAAHSKDASVFRATPRAVLYPKSVADIQAALAHVRELRSWGDRDACISVRAGGTCMSGGSLSEGYVLNLTRHLTSVAVDPAAQTATVEMGAYFRDIESAAKAHGLMFPAYTSSKDTCGIGGMIGNNASGEKSIRFGATIDNVISLEVVLADGRVIETAPVPVADAARGAAGPQLQLLHELWSEYAEPLKKAIGRVRKAASGYRLDRIVDAEGRMLDITPLFVGAQGTLGIVTKAKLRLVPVPTYTRLVIASIETIEDLPDVLLAVSAEHPEGVETFDINTYRRAHEFLPDDARKLEHFFHPKTSLLLLAQFSEDTQAATDMRAHRAASRIAAEVPDAVLQYVDDPSIAQAAWHVRRNSFGVMRDHNKDGFRAVPCIEDVVVPVDMFPAFIPELASILREHGLPYGFHGHIGEGALRIIPVFDFRDPQVGDAIVALMRDVLPLVKRCDGNLSADHSDGFIRTPFIKEFYGPKLYEAFATIKTLFDPEEILNPGKKVGGTLRALAAHLDR